MADTSVASGPDSTQPSTPNGDGQTPGGGSSSPLKLTGPALWAAILALVVWVAFSVVMLFFVAKSEKEWTRVAVVFGSIQSVAFAAAGAIFGSSVQQQNVSNARQDAASAKKDAANAKQDAATQRETAIKGRALATALMADGATAAPAETGQPRGGPGPATESADVVRRRHAQLARTLFADP